MVNKRLSFSEVLDVFAFRIVVDDVDSCYRMLGVVHNLYKPVQNKFKDYIRSEEQGSRDVQEMAHYVETKYNKIKESEQIDEIRP